jgi:hypothetical protein
MMDAPHDVCDDVRRKQSLLDICWDRYFTYPLNTLSGGEYGRYGMLCPSDV